MSAVLSHPNIAINWLLEKLNVAALTNLTVNGRAVQGIYYLAAPQETTNPYPCLIINPPFVSANAQRLQINGPWITAVRFDVDIRCVARDVEPNDAGLLALRAKAIELTEGISGDVDGGRVGSSIVWSFPPDQRLDRGNYIYSEIAVTMRLETELD